MKWNQSLTSSTILNLEPFKSDLSLSQFWDMIGFILLHLVVLFYCNKTVIFIGLNLSTDMWKLSL